MAHGTKLTHVKAFRIVNTVIINLKGFTKAKATFTILNVNHDLFGEQLKRNIMGGGGGGIEGVDIWLTRSDAIPVSEMLFKILQGAMSVLEHQYASYLSHSNEDLVHFEEVTITTTVHDIAAEQEVGMGSASTRKALGATMIYITSTKSIVPRIILKLFGNFRITGSKGVRKIKKKLKRNIRAEIMRRIGERRVCVKESCKPRGTIRNIF